MATMMPKAQQKLKNLGQNPFYDDNTGRLSGEAYDPHFATQKPKMPKKGSILRESLNDSHEEEDVKIKLGQPKGEGIVKDRYQASLNQ